MQKHVDEFKKKAKENPETAVQCFADDGKMLLPHHDAICGRDGKKF